MGGDIFGDYSGYDFDVFDCDYPFIFVDPVRFSATGIFNCFSGAIVSYDSLAALCLVVVIKTYGPFEDFGRRLSSERK